MKTAIAIPDPVFARAQAYARRHRMAHSALFTVAVAEYLDHHRDDCVTRQLDAVYAKQDATLDPVLERLQGLALRREDW